MLGLMHFTIPHNILFSTPIATPTYFCAGKAFQTQNIIMNLSNDILQRNEHYDIDYNDQNNHHYTDHVEEVHTDEETFPSDFMRDTVPSSRYDEIILTPRDRRRLMLRYGLILVAVVMVLVVLFKSSMGQSSDNNNNTSNVYSPPKFPTKFPPIPDNEALKKAVQDYLEGKKEQVEAHYGPIQKWNTTFCTDFTRLFDVRRVPNAIHFNEDISKWDTRNVFQFTGCFYGASSFNRPLYWETGNAHHFIGMFRGASQFNGDVSSFDVSQGRNFVGMFEDAESFQQDLSHWELRHVETIHRMFKGARKFSSDLSKWNVSYVERFDSMFEGASRFNANLDPWAVEYGRNFTRMFKDAASFDSNLCSWRLKIQFEPKKKLPVQDIFNGSACADTRDLWLGRRDFPFCQWCNY